MPRWKPNTTVAAVIERDGRFLLVREATCDGLRLNQPAGHLEAGESLLQAVARETLEETGWEVAVESGIGIYMARRRHDPDGGSDVTYLRFAFACRALAHQDARALDHGIESALWLDAAQIRARRAEHRSPMVMQAVDDYLAGKRFPLDLIHTDPACLDRHD